jgi:23S rRNA (cytosine1962-C5)-methyltransferase
MEERHGNADRPVVKLVAGQGKRLRAGAPWVFSNEIAMRPEYRRMPAGTLIQLAGQDGTSFGTFLFDSHALLAARLLDRDPLAEIDTAWMFRRLEAAIALRSRVCDGDYHRLVDAEGDMLPGIVVDRYGDAVDVRADVAGAERLVPAVVSALRALLPVRTGEVFSVPEGGVRFSADLAKAGWFFDRREMRDRVAALSAGATVLDVCCGSGAFGLRCLAARAKFVTLLDSSVAALGLARDTALANGFADAVDIRLGDAFDTLGVLAGTEQRFDIVICDPPALSVSKKDVDVGLRAYGRLARLAASVVAPGGLLLLTCASPFVSAESWGGHVAYGLHRVRREGRVLWRGGAGPDHPVHPSLPETAVLKGMLVWVG